MIASINNSKNKIVILCPYFGKLPGYYKYTMATMATNEFIDWYIITDDIFDDKQYSNVFCIESKFDEIQKIISKEFDCKINKVYKLCDYKPLYGIIFQELIKGYEYWGYSDLDILFGDLSRCLSDNNLSRYDKIFELGHLSIYRNDAQINSICTSIENYGYDLKTILNSDGIYVLDETYGKNHISINELLEQNGYSVLRKVHGCKDTIFSYRNLYIFNEKKESYTYFKFDNGKLYVCNWKNESRKEIIYAHFQKRRFINMTYKAENEFAVTPKGFCEETAIRKKDFYSRACDLKIWWYIKYRIKRWIDNKRNKWR